MSVVLRARTRRALFLDLLILLAILAVAAGFRFHNLQQWDSGTHQHPDERFLTDVAQRVKLPSSLGDYFVTQRSTINPYAQGFNQYAYGQLPLTLTRAAGQLVGMTSFENVVYVGRALSALADLATIVLTWLLARKVFGRRHAHLAALLLAVCVLGVQLSHFFAVDTFVAPFAAATLLFGQRAWQRDSLRDALLAGICAGLATACKISAALLLPVLALAFLWPRRGRFTRDHLLDGLTMLGVALLGLFVAFRVAEPYAFMGPSVLDLRLNQQWFADKLYWADVSSGKVDVPYMIQWAGTPAYTFVLRQVVLWGMGPALGVTAFAGLAVCGIRFLLRGRREREALLVLAWAAGNFLYFGGQYAKFLRYLLPAYFAFAILAAYLLLLLLDGSRRASLARWLPSSLVRAARVGVTAGVAAVLAGATLWTVAFSAIYDSPHSRIQASEWIYANIPAGKTLGVEHWDDRMPLSLPGSPETQGSRYKYVELTLYDPDNQAKLDKLVNALSQADYVILASRRLSASVPRVPERYPLGTLYYAKLQAGELGFDHVAHIQVMPHLGPLNFDDWDAQEDFTVYDHPTVEVYAKRADFAAAAVRQTLSAAPIGQAIQVKPVDSGKGGLLLTPAEQAAAVAGGTWSKLFDRDGWTNKLALPVWLVAAELLALAAVPLLWRIFRFVPDRGYGASKILGLALVSYVGWLLASLKVAPFGFVTLSLAWLAMLGASALVVWRNRATFLAWLRQERRLLLATEVVYLAGFALFTAIRAMNPDLWHPAFGGEKPMNFAYLNAVTKSDYFPPYDPWFAGGIINYYYYGFVLVATLIKLTGILPEIAFNLAEGTFYGALAAGVFGVAFALGAAWRGRVRRTAGYVGALFATLLVCLLGNLDAGLQLIDQLSKLGQQANPAAQGAVRLAFGLLAVLQGQRFPPLDFWRSTRVIGPEDPGPITEFPYFTFLYGDLHAHQLALPLTVAAILVALNLWRSGRAFPRRVALGSLLLGGLLVGMLRATNTWDFPTYMALIGAALLFGFGPALLRGERGVAWAVVGSGAIFGIAVLGFFAPYLARYQLFYTGVEPIKAKTALAQYLTIYGLPLFLGGSLFAWYFIRAVKRLSVARAAPALEPRAEYYSMLVPGLTPGALPRTGVGFWLGTFGVLLALTMWAAGYPTRAVALAGASIAGGGCIAWWRHSSRSFQAMLVSVALLATLLPEFVALQGDVGRMNTVFKFSMQAWVLLGIAGGVATGWLLGRARREPILRWLAPAWLTFLAVLLFAAVSYPLFASEGKIGLRFAQLPLSLDGMEYMDYAQYRDDNRDMRLPADAKAIRWLQDNVQGSPAILEGRSPVYRWGNRVSIYTGLPAIMGWDVHEGQQRTGYSQMIQQRIGDVTLAYSTTNPDEALKVLRAYDVKWVYVGGLERGYYPAAGLDKFRAMPQLRLAYDQNGVQIYEVVG